MKIYFLHIIFAAFILLALSCSPSRYLPEGESLYTEANVKITDTILSKKKKKKFATELATLTRPKPNKKILGIRLKLFLYSIAGKSAKEKSFWGWFRRKFGEPPVLASDVNVEYNMKVLQSTIENRGFFHAAVNGDTVTKNRKTQANYTVQTGPLYRINEIHFGHDSSLVTKTILEDSVKTFLRKGNAFNLAIIKAERERIDAALKEKGFYYFIPDYIITEADSTAGNHQVNLYVHPKPEIPAMAKVAYSINDIFIFTNFRINPESADTIKENATFYKGYYLIDRQKQYKPKLFEKTMLFKPGEIYNRTDHNIAINRLVNLGLFKFVKNRFDTAARSDSAKLNAYYYLTPFPKKSIRAEVNASTKSNNLTGSSITIGWRNRNTFKAGELLTIDLTGGFEYQYSSALKGYNTYRAGAEVNLIFPRFVVPFFNLNTKGSFVPKTNILLGYDVLNKNKLYSLNSFRMGYGYNWKESVKKEHQLNPIAITYVQPLHVTPEYLTSAGTNIVLQRAIEKQFILGSNYNYNYNDLFSNKVTSGLYFNGNIDLSGNIAGLLSGADIKNGKVKYIADAAFSQYVRLEGELRYYLKLSSKSLLANRIITGLGFPYGNSLQLPFIKQFFAGGNNSLRAFRSRSVGPGTYKSPPSTVLADESGDIRLELNTELRAKLFSIVNGALFIDAGNIWLYNGDGARPGGKFSNQFLKELAVGTGIGLRFDITFLILRLDVAFPLRKPYLPDGQRWVLNQIQFSDPAWRKENIIYNIAIGYPF